MELLFKKYIDLLLSYGTEILLFIKQCLLKLLSYNIWWSTKVSAKFLSDLVRFSIFFSYIPLDFHESIRILPLKYLMYFLAGINSKQFYAFPEEKYFALLRILNSNLLLIFLLICFNFFW